MSGYQDEDSGYPRGIIYFIVAVVLAIVIAVVFFTSFTVVKAGYVGVITRFGRVERVAYPGVSWKLPIGIEKVTKMDTRVQKEQVDASAASRDLQDVSSVLALNYHLDPAYAPWVFQNIGKEYKDIIIAPAVQDVFKNTTAQYPAAELITQRNAVASNAFLELSTELAKSHIIVDALNIVDFDFSPEYNKAIEDKQVAQQEVETAKQRLAKAQVEAQTAVAKAQGEADAVVARANGEAQAQSALERSGALSPEYLKYLMLTKWNGVLPLFAGTGAMEGLIVNVGEVLK